MAENTKPSDDSNRAAEMLEALKRSSSLVATSLDLDTVLRYIVETVSVDLGYPKCSILMLDESTQTSYVRAQHGFDPSYAQAVQSLRYKPDWSSLAGLVMLTREPVWTRDVLADERFPLLARLAPLGGFRAVLGVPMRARSGMLGVLALYDPQPRSFSSLEVSLLQTFANQAAVALENAQLYRQYREKNVTLEIAFLRIGEALAASTDVRKTLTLISKLAAQMMGAEASSVQLLEQESGELTVEAGFGLEGEAGKWPAPEAIARLGKLVVRLGYPISTADLRSNGLDGAEVLKAFGAGTFLATPLCLADRPIGVLAVFAREPRQYTPREELLLGSFANQVAVAIQKLRLEEDIRAKGARLEAIWRSVGEGLIMLDHHGCVVSINPAAAALTGWPKDTALGRTCCQVLCGDDCPDALAGQAWCLAEAQVRSPGNVIQRKIAIPTETGKRRVLAAVFSAIDKETEPQAWVVALRDVTREEELDQLKTEFVSLVSHELRAPLTNIKAGTQLLVGPGEPLVNRQRAKVARIIADECNRLERFVTNVLDVAHLESGELTVCLEQHDLRRLVRRSAQAFRSGANRGRIRTCGPRHPLLAWCDAEKTMVVLENLLSNALKYSPEGSPVTIALQDAPEGGVAISVRDLGIGIPPEHLGRVFDRFYRVDNGDSRETYGHGLGLFVAKRLVELQGGKIWAESVPGRGSTFTFTLPERPGRASNTPTDENQIRPPEV
ncbi:MAG: GAF domain-containing protein [Chloroflexota bacterium]